MKGIQKLVRNGNSTGVTIPRPVLWHLGWLPGQLVVMTVLEGGELHIRKWRDTDRDPEVSSRLPVDDALVTK